MVIYVRHNTPDVASLDQIVRQGHYRLPNEAAAALPHERRTVCLDLGANVGVFAAEVFAREPDARVVAFEPDPENAALIRRSIEANPGLDWQLVEACAAAADGTVSFAAGRFTNSRIEASGKGGTTVRAVDVFAYANDADFLKIDIEGSEWEILADPRFAVLPAKVVALEYHDYLCPGPDPRRLALESLERAGFVVSDAEFDSTPGHGMLWGWKDG